MRNNIFRKNACAAIAASAALAAVLFVSGCTPTVETLAHIGIEAEIFDAKALEERIAESALNGVSGFSVCYVQDGFSGEEFDRTVQRALDEYYAAGAYTKGVEWDYTKSWGCVEYEIRIQYEPGRPVLELFKDESGALSGQEFSEETLLTVMRERIFEEIGETRLLFETPEGFDESEIETMMIDFYYSDPYASYMVSELNTTVLMFPDYTEVGFTYDMVEGHVPANEIHAVHEPIDAINFMRESFVTGDETPVLYVEDPDFDYDTLMNWIETAIVNDCGDICSEADRIGYMTYPNSDEAGPKVVETFVTFKNDIAEREWCRNELRGRVVEAAAEIREKSGSDERELHRGIFDYIRRSVEYDDALAEATQAETLTKEMLLQRTAYGALTQGKTVCSGYARAYKALCDELGLECYVVYGESDGEPHEWNTVRIDGDVYYVDVTFADSSGRADRYFLFGQKTFEKEGYKVDETYVLPW